MKICDETPILLKIGIVTVFIIKIIIFHKLDMNESPYKGKKR